MPARREFFKSSPKVKYVAVRYIRLSATEVIEPGTELKGFKLYHLRSLYNRRRIGIKGSPWTEEMLKTVGNAYATPEISTSIPRSPVVEETEVETEEVETITNEATETEDIESHESDEKVETITNEATETEDIESHESDEKEEEGSSEKKAEEPAVISPTAPPWEK